MGRRVKLVSDPTVAQPHAAGSKVWLNQACVHKELGALFVRQVPHFSIHLAFARQVRTELAALDAKVEALEVETSGGRHVSDPLLVANLYVVGCNLAIHTVLAFQHLVLTLELLAPANTGEMNLTSRFGAVLKRLGIRTDLSADPGYAALCEIENMRHAIEHPTPDNVYTVNTNDWDHVPLTWIASGRAAAAFDLAVGFLLAMAATAKKTESRRNKGPGSLLNVTRGMKSLNPARKPRSGRGSSKASQRQAST